MLNIRSLLIVVCSAALIATPAMAAEHAADAKAEHAGKTHHAKKHAEKKHAEKHASMNKASDAAKSIKEESTSAGSSEGQQ